MTNSCVRFGNPQNRYIFFKKEENDSVDKPKQKKPNFHFPRAVQSSTKMVLLASVKL